MARLFRTSGVGRHPWLCLGVFALAAGYLLAGYLFPAFDVIPDRIAYFGYVDEIIAVALGGVFAVRAVSDAWHAPTSDLHGGELAREVWALTDNRIGNNNQTLGVAERLGLPVKIVQIDYTLSIRTPNLIRGGSLIGVDAALTLEPPWPKLVIATGRRLAPISRTIKRRSGDRTKIVQMMDPEWGRGDFDLLVVPKHDRGIRGSNVMRVTGAPHRVTQDKLSAAAQEWRFDEALYPRPWVAVLVGGDAKGIRFGVAKAAELGALLSRALSRLGGSVLATTSRRTDPAAGDALLAAVKVPAYFHCWSQQGRNPFFAFLAIANYVVVTGDSISMCAEACATGKPVYIYDPAELTTRKYRRYHDELYARDLARPFSGTLSERWHAGPFDPTSEVVSEVRKFIQRADPILLA